MPRSWHLGAPRDRAYLGNKPAQALASWLFPEGSRSARPCRRLPLSFGQPRPTSRLGGAGWPPRPCFRPRAARDRVAEEELPRLWAAPRRRLHSLDVPLVVARPLGRRWVEASLAGHHRRAAPGEVEQAAPHLAHRLLLIVVRRPHLHRSDARLNVVPSPPRPAIPQEVSRGSAHARVAKGKTAAAFAFALASPSAALAPVIPAEEPARPLLLGKLTEVRLKLLFCWRDGAGPMQPVWVGGIHGHERAVPRKLATHGVRTIHADRILRLEGRNECYAAYRHAGDAEQRRKGLAGERGVVEAIGVRARSGRRHSSEGLTSLRRARSRVAPRVQSPNFESEKSTPASLSLVYGRARGNRSKVHSALHSLEYPHPPREHLSQRGRLVACMTKPIPPRVAHPMQPGRVGLSSEAAARRCRPRLVRLRPPRSGSAA